MSLLSKCIDDEFKGRNLLINLILIFIGLKQTIIPVYQYWLVLLVILLLKCYSIKASSDEGKIKEGFDYSLVKPSNEDMGNIYINPFSKEEVLTDQYRTYKSETQRQQDLLNRLKILDNADKVPSFSNDEQKKGELPSPIPSTNHVSPSMSNKIIDDYLLVQKNKTNNNHLKFLEKKKGQKNKVESVDKNTDTDSVNKLKRVKEHVEELCDIVECNK
jgi:hypothetical protein